MLLACWLAGWLAADEFSSPTPLVAASAEGSSRQSRARSRTRAQRLQEAPALFWSRGLSAIYRAIAATDRRKSRRLDFFPTHFLSPLSTQPTISGQLFPLARRAFMHESCEKVSKLLANMFWRPSRMHSACNPSASSAARPRVSSLPDELSPATRQNKPDPRGSASERAERTLTCPQAQPRELSPPNSESAPQACRSVDELVIGAGVAMSHGR